MAKTLLQLVQDALVDIEGDPVSTLTGDDTTEEAELIAEYAKQTYEFMHADYDWPYIKELNTLEGLSDSDFPTYLRLPTDVNELMWFKYDGKKLTYLDPEEFMDISISRKTAFDNGDTSIEKKATLNGVDLYVKNDVAPTYYTSFNNEHLVCDSYDNTEDTTLQQSKTMAMVVKTPVFTISDTFVPDIPDNMIPFFQAELNRVAQTKLRQTTDPVSERRALKGNSKMKTKSDRINKKRYSGFGRK